MLESVATSACTRSRYARLPRQLGFGAVTLLTRTVLFVCLGTFSALSLASTHTHAPREHLSELSRVLDLHPGRTQAIYPIVVAYSLTVDELVRSRPGKLSTDVFDAIGSHSQNALRELRRTIGHTEGERVLYRLNLQLVPSRIRPAGARGPLWERSYKPRPRNCAARPYGDSRAALYSADRCL